MRAKQYTLLVAGVVMATAMGLARGAGAGPFATIEPVDTRVGYIARLLINESPFPGERGYVSVEDSKMTMVQILWVLDSRLQRIPARYTQRQVAGLASKDIIDLITGTGGRPQCEGFSRNASGKAVTARRVEERLNYLLEIANTGGKPGKFAGLINYGVGLARAYEQGGIEEVDLFAGLQAVGKVAVTGRAYSWMTDVNNYHPGGNFVKIPDSEDGALGGNRFFTLRKDPK